MDLIRSEYLMAIGSELPSCARLTDAVAAFGTIEFMTEVDSSGRITQAQQDLIESKLQNAKLSAVVQSIFWPSSIALSLRSNIFFSVL